MFELRDYQKDLSQKGCDILKRLSIVYLSMEVRTGKTLTALSIAESYGAKNVLFLTKKKAISSIQDDYTLMSPSYRITVINNESAHKFLGDYDLLISDEHHRNGAFPKANAMTKFIHNHYSHLPMIFLSGTPHPESYSQIYHQFWCSDFSPFTESNFYKWARKYVDIQDRRLGYAVVKDYSKAFIRDIKPIISPYMVTFNQKQAGFSTEVRETTLFVKMEDRTYKLADKLKKDKFLISKDNREVIADTAVKMMQKLHQIYSGTVLFEDKTSRILDKSKAEFIKDTFKDKKIGIFYKFRAEYELLKEVFGDELTDNLSDFNKSSKNIALQIVSGSEGISLREADCLVYYNIDFSAKNYWQSRDRLTTMDRKENDVYWVFASSGIEEKIYRQVLAKKSYTSSVFKKDFY